MTSHLKLIFINIGIYTTVIGWTLMCVLLSPIFFIFCTRISGQKESETLRRMIWYYGFSCSKLMSLFVDIKWPEQPELPSLCIIVANHESFFDPYLVSFQPVKSICMAVRNWPFKIPFYGFYMRKAGYINVESDDLGHIREQAFRALDDGATLMFFPEGTRSRDGNLNRFHSGPFHIAIEAGIPVVPLCLSGTFDMLSRGSMIIRPSKVRGKILPPVYPEQFKGKQNAHIELRREVKKIMVPCILELKQNGNA